MANKQVLEEIKRYETAQHEAEQAGNEYFTCPLCQGRAFWTRSDLNNHLFSRCEKCGFVIME